MPAGLMYRSARGKNVRRRKVRRKRKTTFTQSRKNKWLGTVAIPPNRFGIPDVYRCKLAEQFSVTLTADGTYNNAFIMQINSLFDSDKTNAGTQAQPPYFDQLKLLYFKYRVKACKITVNYKPTAATVGGSQYLTMFATHDSSTLPTTASQAYGNAYNRTWYTNALGAPNQVVSLYVNMNKFLGKDMSNEADDAALIAADPTQSIFCVVQNQTINGSTAAAGILFIKMVFYCEFFKRQAGYDA